MSKIDLAAIMANHKLGIKVPIENFSFLRKQVKDMMKEAIHQALVLVTKEAKVTTSDTMHPKGYPYGMVNQKPNANEEERYFRVDEQSILDVEKLIV